MLGVGSGFLMNLAIARTMGATEAGFYLLALATVIFLSSLCRVGLDNTVLRFVGASAESGRWGVVNAARSEEHTSELQSLMRISYAVFCLKKKKKKTNTYL